jgi:hypothetical protein
MNKLLNKIYEKLVRISPLFLYSTFAFADGEDILKAPMANFFTSVLGTGLDALLVIEVCYGSYLFTTAERKTKVFVGTGVVLLLTAFLRAKFAGG